MPATRLLDDDTIDALVRGDAVPPQHRDLAAFAARVRAAGEGPPPRPSEALAAVLAGGIGADVDQAADARDAAAARHRGSRRGSRLAKVAGLGVAVKLTLGASAAAAGVLGAGAAGVLPGTADDTVRDAIEAVTPLEFPGRDTGDHPPRGNGPGGAPAARDGQDGGTGPGTTGDRPDAGDEWPGQGNEGPTPADQSDRGVADGAPDGSPPDDGTLPDEAEQRRADPPAPPAPPSTVPDDRPAGETGETGETGESGAPATTPTTDGAAGDGQPGEGAPAR